MNAADYMILLAVALAVLFAARFIYRRRRNGGCCGGCGGCSGNCAACKKDCADRDKKQR